MAQRGRPRAYDPEKVLDIAMRLFWEHGYEGTSMSDLTDAMGINRRSLYAEYGSKEKLFEVALARYLEGPGAFPYAAVAKPTAYEVAEFYLHQAVLTYTCAERPRGCMTVQGGLACSAEAETVRAELAGKRRMGIELLTERFVRAAAEGDLPTGTDPSALAGYLVALNHGLSVQAGGGITRAELMRFVDQALLLWPGRPSEAPALSRP